MGITDNIISFITGRHDIQSLLVKCNNVERQCMWVGTVETLDKHMATCEFSLLPCPKQCKDDHGDTKLILRRDMEEHLKEACPNRDHQCQYCEEKGTYATITEIHDQICLKNPNSDCQLTMQSQDIKEHVRSTCACTIIPCK